MKSPSTLPKVLVFDLEADALLREATRVHCISLCEPGKSPRLFTNRRDREMPGVCEGWSGYIEDALGLLGEADVLVGHNILRYDLPLLEKLYGFEYDPLQTFDTILASRIIYGDSLPAHGLEAWGYRLGILKGDFKKQADDEEKVWDRMTAAMGSYCNQDVRVTDALYKELLRKVPPHLPSPCWDMERMVAFIIQKQEATGVYLDQEQALALYAELSKEYNREAERMKTLFPPIVKPKGSLKSSLFTPKRDNSRLGYKAGCRCTKIEVCEFNPGSRVHIFKSLIRKYGWRPTKFTDTGDPKVDEATLGDLPYPEAQQLAHLFLLKKTMGQVHDGDNGWLKIVDPTTSRIHGSVNTNGAVTGRMTHSKPNMAQVPSTHHYPKDHPKAGEVAWGVEGRFGADCRACFGATPGSGRVFVGCDASGLELRMLAHYMGFWDGGAYRDELLSGDIHTANQRAAGLPTRDNAKTFIYAFLYGAGNGKIGKIIGKGPGAGGKLKKKFLANTPALAKLQEAVATKARKHKYLKGLDGRILRVRHQHAALNTLLQGAGACVMKKALVNLWNTADRSRFDFVLNVHDEFQAEVDADYAEEFGRLAVEAIRQAGIDFDLRCPLDGEYKIGNTWQETH